MTTHGDRNPPAGAAADGPSDDAATLENDAAGFVNRDDGSGKHPPWPYLPTLAERQRLAARVLIERLNGRENRHD